MAKVDMSSVFNQIITKPLLVKKTNYMYSDDFKFSRVERVTDYYIEKNRKFTWLKHWRGNVFVFGSPFGGYSF